MGGSRNNYNNHIYILKLNNFSVLMIDEFESLFKINYTEIN